MAAVPAWSAARAGLLGDTGGVDHASQIDQFLGTHPTTTVYNGSQILQPTGSGGSPGSLNLGVNDWSQPFTMSGTAIGRVVVPVAPVGNGTDLTVSLCADSSGSPGTVIVSTRTAAKALLALVATASLAAGSASQLATAASNALTAGPGTNIAYTPPAVSVAGGGASAGSTTAGNSIYLVGGVNGSFQAVSSVFSITYTGGTALAPPVPQPSIPQAVYIPGVAATSDTLVVAGGVIPGSPSGTTVSSVFTASLNTATGTVGAWSTQASLPQALQDFGIASSGENIYVVGGANGAAVPQSTVYQATVQNGQITAWNTVTPLPSPNSGVQAAVVNGFLVVTDSTASPGVIRYAAINADGTLSSWQVGPTVPNLLFNIIAAVPGAGLVLLDQILTGPVNVTETFTFGPNGPAPLWQVQKNAIPSAQTASQIAVFATGASTWQLFSLLPNNTYFTQQLTMVPNISVPLPASGLTNAATYHVVLSQQGGDTADYLAAGIDQNVYTGNPTALYRARSGGSTWTATTAGQAIPVQVFNQAASGQPVHTWLDSGAAMGTPIWATTPDVRLLGLLEGISQPGPVLNANPTFTAGAAPWAATGGTLIKSAAHVQGGLPFSGLLTPSGSASSSYIECEQVAVFQGHSMTGTAWLYSPTGYANVALNINWYKADHTSLSTTSGTVTSLAANTWTQFATTGAVPANAAYGTIVPVETGTPSSSAVLYVSAATLQDASGPMLPSIAQVNYGGTWPSSGIYPPLGITQLA